jgi:hypothetical protein
LVRKAIDRLLARLKHLFIHRPRPS